MSEAVAPEPSDRRESLGWQRIEQADAARMAWLNRAVRSEHLDEPEPPPVLPYREENPVSELKCKTPGCGTRITERCKTGVCSSCQRGCRLPDGTSSAEALRSIGVELRPSRAKETGAEPFNTVERPKREPKPRTVRAPAPVESTTIPLRLKFDIVTEALGMDREGVLTELMGAWLEQLKEESRG